MNARIKVWNFTSYNEQFPVLYNVRDDPLLQLVYRSPHEAFESGN